MKTITSHSPGRQSPSYYIHVAGKDCCTTIMRQAKTVLLHSCGKKICHTTCKWQAKSVILHLHGRQELSDATFMWQHNLSYYSHVTGMGCDTTFMWQMTDILHSCGSQWLSFYIHGLVHIWCYYYVIQDWESRNQYCKDCNRQLVTPRSRFNSCSLQ